VSTLVSPIQNANRMLDDLRQGYIVIIAARWILVAAGLMFILYRPQSTTELSVGVLAVLGIAAINFWLHTRPLTNQPVEPVWAYCASAADLAVISGLVLLPGGPASRTFVFYYPAILAYSLVFPVGVTVLLSAGVLSFVAMRGLETNLDERILVWQLLSLAATAFIGWRYREVEKRRRRRRAELSSARAPFGAESTRTEAQEDLYYGQIVCIAARWFVVAGAIFLAVYHATSVGQMQRSLIPLLMVIAANFFLQARYMMGRPANALLLKVIGAVDLVVITGTVVGGSTDFFVFFYPVALAFALVFARRITLIYTGVLGLGYVLISVLLPPGIHFDGDEETLAIRLITLLSTTLLGTMYWRLQRARRPSEVV